MRVLSALCLLLGVSSVVGQYTFTANSNFNAWDISTLGSNPTLTLTEGTAYTFTMGFDNAASNPAHPFAFSADGSNAAATITAIDVAFTVTKGGACSGTGIKTDGYTGNGCVLTLTPTAGTATKQIFYRCTAHPAMVGTINVVAAASSSSSTGTSSSSSSAVDSSSSSTGSVVPSSSSSGAVVPSSSSSSSGAVAPSSSSSSSPAVVPPTSGGTLSGSSFRITGFQSVNGTYTGYIFTSAGVQYLNPTLSLTVGTSVSFSLEFAGPHPFGFSPLNNATVTATTAFFPPPQTAADLVVTGNCTQMVANVSLYTPTTPGTPNSCVLTVPITVDDIGTLYYRCGYHSLMIGSINIAAAAAGSSSSSSSTGSSSPSSSSSTGSSGTPTAPPSTSSSSTGNKGAASKVAGAGLALVIAGMSAIMA